MVMDSTSLDNLNKEVLEKFNQIRTRILGDFSIPIAVNVVEKLLDRSSMSQEIKESTKEYIKDKRESTDKVLDFISSMNLPNTLSLASGYIFAYNETKDKS